FCIAGATQWGQAPRNPAATGSPSSVDRYGCTPGWRSRRETLGANGVLRSSVTSTEVTRGIRATCIGPTHRLLRLARLNGSHPRPVNAHATTKRGGMAPRAPAAFAPGAVMGILGERPGGRVRGNRAERCNGGAGRGHLHRKGKRTELLDG